MRPKIDLPTCLAIMQACWRKPRTLAELEIIAGKSTASTFRAISDIREQLLAELHRDDGRYKLTWWGLINKDALP